MDKRIRQLAVETVVNTENDLTKLSTFVYTVGQVRKLPIFEKTKFVERTIREISETETHYKLFISDNEVSQEWKNIPKSSRVIIEYFIE